MRGGYALDAKPDGFGLIQLAYHASAVHADPVTDNLYLALDENDEPTSTYLPSTNSPIPDGLTIYQFDADPSQLMNYSWKGKLHLVPYPVAMQWQRVQAADFSALVARGYEDGVMQFEKAITGNREFRSHRDGLADVSYEQELVGTSRVRMMSSTEDVDELVQQGG